MLDKLVPNLKVFGASLWVAWQLVLYGCEVTFFGISLGSTEVASVYVTVCLVFSAALVLAGALHRQVFPLVGRVSFVVGMGLLAAVGTMGVFVLQLAGGWWYLVGAGVAGVGTAFIACRSIVQFAELGPREVIFVAALVQVLAFGVDYTVLSVATAVQPWLFFALPLGAALLMCLESEENRICVPDEGWKMSPCFWRFAVGMLFFAVPVSICRACFPLFASESAVLVDYRRISGVLIIAIMLVLAVVSARLPRGARCGLLMYRTLLVTSLLYVVIGAFGPSSGVAMSLSGAVNALMNLCVWVLLSRIAFMSGASTLRVFGFGYSAFTVGGAAGWGVGLAADAFALSLETVLVVLAATTVIALFVALFLFRQSDLGQLVEPVYALEDEAAGEGAAQGTAPRTATRDDGLEEFSAWRYACLLVAEEAQLSAREGDVFELMARGYSARMISEELCISYNTARNHIQRIYAKCDVHSRDELQARILACEPRATGALGATT